MQRPEMAQTRKGDVMKTGIFNDGERDFGYVWKFCDGNGKRVFTQVPTCILWSIVDGQLTLSEVKMVLYISRMSYGFRRDVADCYLSLDDFAKNTFTAKSHVSKALSSLLKKRYIIRGQKLRGGHKYAINLAQFGLEMKPVKQANSKAEGGIDTYEVYLEQYAIRNGVYDQPDENSFKTGS